MLVTLGLRPHYSAFLSGTEIGAALREVHRRQFWGPGGSASVHL